ncbi:hypothetical protein AYO44_05755 [Planctomycetaceae bacterium SCGC AG-212-F19]|nr:hypothetical protein AYO44_05755 [Planctomycetaceae bacterium SCGC AG-212-F19]
MSFQSFKSAVDSLFSPGATRARKSQRRAAFRPDVEALEARLVPTTYSTNFDLTEYPISEGSVWHHTPNAWTYVTTANGLAYGTNGPANAYDDSYAYLSGFGANQQAEAVVALPGTRVGAPEVELMLRMADTPTSVRGYEINSNIQIVRWNGAMGDFTVLPTTGPGLGRAMVTGDDFKATIVGNLISVYVNGNLVMQATDSVWTDGQPGIGFFKRPGYSDLAFTSYTATDGLGGSNQPPTVQTAASASPNTVTGRTSILSVLGADDGGESNLTYTWTTSSVPSGATPTFSANGTNAAKNSTVTFNKAGTYTFQVTIRDAGGLTATSSTNVTVNQTLTGIGVSPANVTLNNGATQQFTATATDQFALPLTTQPSFTWSLGAGSVGTINGSGLYTAPASGTGTATLRAASGAVSGTAGVTVATASAFSAHINFSNSTGAVPVGYVNDVGLVYGSRGNGLTFGWNADMTSAARDRNDPTAPDELHDSLIHVGTSIWEIAVPNGTYTVHVVVGDPSFADVNSKLTAEGVLTINGFTSSSQRWLEGTATVTVSDGRLTISEQAGSYDKIDFIDITSVGAANQPPTVATAAAASPGTVAGSTTNLTVLGADDGGEANLTYTWAATSVPSGATPVFSANGTNAAKNASVTFNKAGSYTFQVSMRDAGGLAVTSSVNVTVNQTLTTVAVAPASASLADGATQQFSATGNDQFGNSLSTQPAIAWSLGTGSIGTVSSSGLYTAPATGAGSATVRATSGSVTGTASVTVTAGSLFTAHINFSNNTTQVPAGYVNDTGLAYGNRGNGMTYGWSADNTGNARDRDAANSPDEQHDSLIHMGGQTWSIAVPNGTYTLHVAVGDPSYADVVSKLTVNGVLTINGSTSSSQRWLEGTVTVTVSNGLLTVGEQAGAYDKIDFIDITQGSPEYLAGTPLGNARPATLTQAQLGRVVAQAIQLWAATGLSSVQAAALHLAQFVIADLPGGLLGDTVGIVIYIDTNAAGYGWALGQRVAPHQVDLLTVIAHELGHELGLADLDTQANAGNVMDGTLAPGLRRLPCGSSGYAADASHLDIRWLERGWATQDSSHVFRTTRK